LTGADLTDDDLTWGRFDWKSTIPPISTKRTMISDFNSLNTKKDAYDVGNQGPGLGQARQCGGVKLLL